VDTPTSLVDSAGSDVAHKPLRPLPPFAALTSSPELVEVMDKIRFGPLGDRDDYGEFTWFIREYPRIYRHHFDHAKFRLLQIRAAYALYHDDAVRHLSQAGYVGDTSRMRRGPGEDNTYAIYWNFESYLAAVCSALDVAARIVGTAYKVETPLTFNRFCKTAPEDDLRALFTRAQERWVRRLKAYRDCFVHFTPVDTLLMVGLREYPDCWQIRARIPTNPHVREILRFRFSRRVELLTYATTVWRHLIAFDRAMARLIWQRYRAGTYPVRIERLFFLGRVAQPQGDPAEQ
jgi:hypothetical protein